MLRVAERSAAEWIVLVSALTLGDHVLLVTCARTRLDAHTTLACYTTCSLAHNITLVGKNWKRQEINLPPSPSDVSECGHGKLPRKMFDVNVTFSAVQLIFRRASVTVRYMK